LTVSVVDRRVKEILAELVITGVFVGIDNRTHFHVVVDFTAQRRMARILNRHGLCFAAALPHAEDDRFPGSTTWAGTPRFLVGMAVALFSADKHFIHLDDTTQHRKIVAAGFANSAKNEPRGLLRDAD